MNGEGYNMDMIVRFLLCIIKTKTPHKMVLVKGFLLKCEALILFPPRKNNESPFWIKAWALWASTHGPPPVEDLHRLSEINLL